jgi:hypothetical protein
MAGWPVRGPQCSPGRLPGLRYSAATHPLLSSPLSCSSPTSSVKRREKSPPLISLSLPGLFWFNRDIFTSQLLLTPQSVHSVILSLSVLSRNHHLFIFIHLQSRQLLEYSRQSSPSYRHWGSPLCGQTSPIQMGQLLSHRRILLLALAILIFCALASGMITARTGPVEAQGILASTVGFADSVAREGTQCIVSPWCWRLCWQSNAVF